MRAIEIYVNVRVDDYMNDYETVLGEDSEYNDRIRSKIMTDLQCECDKLLPANQKEGPDLAIDAFPIQLYGNEGGEYTHASCFYILETDDKLNEIEYARSGISGLDGRVGVLNARISECKTDNARTITVTADILDEFDMDSSNYGDLYKLIRDRFSLFFDTPLPETFRCTFSEACTSVQKLANSSDVDTVFVDFEVYGKTDAELSEIVEELTQASFVVHASVAYGVMINKTLS